MALINCPDCNTEVSDKAIQCPKCAYPISTINNLKQTSSNRQIIENVTVNVQQPNLSSLILSSKKSQGTSFILTFFFGPFGLFYGNPKKAGYVFIFIFLAFLVIMLLTNGRQGSYNPIAGLLGIISWIASIVLGLEGVEEYNKSLIETSSYKSMETNINFDQIERLRQLIINEKNKPFYAESEKRDILKSLNLLCDTKENTQILLSEYYKRYYHSLIQDLKELGGSLNEKNEYISNFLEYGLTE